MGEFAGAFHDADRVEVLDIYAASEEPIAGVDAQALVKEIRAAGGSGVEYAGSVAEAVKALVKEARPEDVILTLGAGSVSQAGLLLLDGLAAKG
jgi:UDP-N-acetylmuramate--alanine ligase